MAIAATALNLLAFPQAWDGGTLTVRFLCLPQGDPEAALAAGQPAFAAADLSFEARLIGSLDHLPRAADSAPFGPLALTEPPTQKAALFAEMREAFKIGPDEPAPAPGAPPPRFRKPVTKSYRALVGDRQLSPGLTDADEYECALHEAHEAQPLEPVELPQTWSWGEALAFALRQPKLAMAAGLIGEAEVTPPDPAFFARGGWLYVGLAAGSDYVGAAGLTTSFAARIPPLAAGTPRGVYAAVLFPLDNPGVADDAYPEAERYDRGFARLAHGAQGDGLGDGIRLAWDDEQVADAFARQVAADSSGPMGTAGYRVDVRDVAGDGKWRSLQRVASLGPLQLGDVVIGPYRGEQIVEVVPVQASPARPGDFWMPPYFCTWRGSSLVLTDPDLTQLHQGLSGAAAASAQRLGRDQILAPVGDKDTLLRYGHTYEFRVRLADLSRGGPAPSADTPDDPDGQARYVAEVAFRRHRPPGQVQIMGQPTQADPVIRIKKPMLRHPELLFTGAHSFAELLPLAAVARTDEIGLADPDVDTLAIRVEVRALLGDHTAWLPLYETTRPFVSPDAEITIEAHDVATLGAVPAGQPAAGPLEVPTARDVRISLQAVGRDQPNYFANDAARFGPAATVEVRAPAQFEDPLFAGDLRLDSAFFRAAGPDGDGGRPLERLAQAFELTANDLTLIARPGDRTVFGCASSVRHVLSPERASTTLASDAELAQRWINVLQFELDRDWTWDGLAPDGLAVRRTIARPGRPPETQLVGAVGLPRALPKPLAPLPTGGLGVLARDPQRAAVRVVFLDALDPKPAPDEFPAELTVTYEIVPTLREGIAAADPLQADVLLPVTTPPVQTPRLVSAGLALSPPEPAADYASTQTRRRSLWLEFNAPPADPQDSYFVRVLAYAPDPLLIEEEIAELRPEPALAVDAEWMRHIVPAQPRDDSGLRALQPLAARSATGAHYLIPLPEGLDAESPELLGLFTYEVRLGHAGARWSTAQGRFGPPLRIAGVQHPAPPLACQVARIKGAIHVRAPFATAVLGGRHLRPHPPKTRLWAVLYARVRQADAAAWRNLMLLRSALWPQQEAREAREALPPRLYGERIFDESEVRQALARRGLSADAPLTALVVEFHTEPEISDPLGANLGNARMLRVSPLVPVPDAC